MNIFDAILEAIDNWSVVTFAGRDIKLNIDNVPQLEYAKQLVEQLRDEIKNLQSDDTNLMYATGFAACRGKILNMEVKND